MYKRQSVNFTTNAAKQDYYQSAFLLGKSYTGNKSTPDLTSIDGYRLSGFGYNAYWSTTATYDVTFNEKHHLNTMIGYDFEYNSDFEVQQDDRTCLLYTSGETAAAGSSFPIGKR